MDSARHIIGCSLTQETRGHNAFDDGATTFHASLPSVPLASSQQSSSAEPRSPQRWRRWRRPPPPNRGVHSYNIQLNDITCCGVRWARGTGRRLVPPCARGSTYVVGVGYVGRLHGVSATITTQVELGSGREEAPAAAAAPGAGAHSRNTATAASSAIARGGRKAERIRGVDGSSVVAPRGRERSLVFLRETRLLSSYIIDACDAPDEVTVLAHASRFVPSRCAVRTSGVELRAA